MTDHILGIQTDGIQKDSKHSYYNHRYEPTAYELIDSLFEHLTLTSTDTFLDFGCGKGRLNFYATNHFHCASKGIELNSDYYQDCLDNLNTYKGNCKEKINFFCLPAQSYLFNKEDTCFYFFNPFSIEIFQKVMNNLCESLEEFPRKVLLILYYPDAEYIDYLDHYTYFDLLEKIKFSSNKDEQECFLIYSNSCLQE